MAAGRRVAAQPAVSNRDTGGSHPDGAKIVRPHPLAPAVSTSSSSSSARRFGWLYDAGRARGPPSFAAPGQMMTSAATRCTCEAGRGRARRGLRADEGAWSTHWGRLPEDVSSVTLSIAYDRGSGLERVGAAPATPRPSRAAASALARVAPACPSCWSGRTAAHALGLRASLPFETAGLVLVDPLHDGFVDRLQREQIPTVTPSQTLMRISSICGAFGLLRLLQAGRSTNAALRVTERQRAALDALELDPRVRRAAADEIVAEPGSLEFLGRLNESMEIPVRVIASTETLTGTDLPADFPVERYNRIWTEESERFLEVSRRAERLLVDGSGHQLQLERPEVVLEAILDVIDAARSLQAERDEEAAADPMGNQPALEGRA